MKTITISDLDGLRAACRIARTLYGFDAYVANWLLRNNWDPLDLLAMRHGLDLIDAALVRVLRECAQERPR